MTLTDKERYKAKVKALDFLYKKRYFFVCRIACGRFSTFFAVKTPIQKSLVAAKIIAAGDTWSGELELWENFSHENIVQLLRVITLPRSNVFIMPLYMTSLLKIFHQNEFRSARSSFTLTKTWILDVARGLSYLHCQGVCHLNLQPSNILISMKRQAAIGDFSFVNTATEPVNHYGVPKKYSPPECWIDTSEDHPFIKGTPYDLWSLGMTAFNVLTDHMLENSLSRLNNWNVDFFPHMYDALKPEKFIDRIFMVFPKADINNKDIRDALNFIRGLLRREPSERPDISTVLEHTFLLNGNVISLFSSDIIWMFYQDESYEESSISEDEVQRPRVEAGKQDATGASRDQRMHTNKFIRIVDWFREKLRK